MDDGETITLLKNGDEVFGPNAANEVLLYASSCSGAAR